MSMQLFVRRRNFALGVALALTIWIPASLSFGQTLATTQSQLSPSANAASPIGAAAFPGQALQYEYRIDAQGRAGYHPVQGEAAEEQREMMVLQEQLRSKSASEEDKESARKKMTDLLAKQFDRDLESRAKQITALELQLEKLKEQVEKRRGVKDRLIELRLELMLNEAEGLGFPSSWNVSPGNWPAPQVLQGGVYQYAPAALPGSPTVLPNLPPSPVSPARR